MSLPIVPSVSPSGAAVGESARGSVAKAPTQSAPLSFAESKVESANDKGVISVQAIDEAVGRINTHLKFIPTALQFRVDHDTGKIVVKVVNSETNEVLRQIPTDEVLVIAKALRDWQSNSGLIVNETA
jgi:flagellar protein FlaG